MSSDPRRGLPSASSMHRDANCPGAQALINSLRQAGKHYELPSRAASSGIRIHDYLAVDALGGTAQASDFFNAMSSEERAVAHKAAEIRDSLVQECLGNSEKEIIVERRFRYRQGFELRFSGQPDFIAIKGPRAFVANFKTGRKEAEPAADNLQLRTEIVLLKHNRPELEETHGAIVEPLVSWDSERVGYGEEALAKAEAQILAIVDRVQWESDKRIAGPWCQYCPARAYCAEARAYIETIPNPNAGTIIKELPRGEAGVLLWKKIKVARQLLDTLEQTYEEILRTEPDALPGYILPEKGRPRRIVPYPARFKEALAEVLTPEEIDGCATFSPAKVQELLAIKHKLEPKEARTVFERLTRDTISTVFDAPFVRPLSTSERKRLETIK